MALVGLAGSCRQRLNFGVEQMGASDGHHRAAFACFATEFRATQGYKDVDSGKDVFSQVAVVLPQTEHQVRS
jgi:hypothetical protein